MATPVKFPRISQKQDIPAIDVDRQVFDKIRARVDISDSNGNKISLLDVKSFDVTYSRGGNGGPFVVDVGRKTLQELSKNNTSGLVKGDVFRWLREAGILKVEVFAKSSLSGQNGGADFELIQEGDVDFSNVHFHEDDIKFNCRDKTALLWEERLFPQNLDSPNSIDIINAIAGLADLNTTFLDRDDNIVSSIERELKAKIGLIDAVNGNTFLLKEGIRAWDLLHYAASIDDVDVFIYRNTLFYLRQNSNLLSAGFILTHGKNCSLEDVTHSAYQQKDAVLILQVVNTINPPAAGGGVLPGLDPNIPLEQQEKQIAETAPTGTYYVVRDQKGARLALQPPKRAEFKSPARIYNAVRYNIEPTDPKIQTITDSLYRELVNREFIIRANFAGHLAASPMETFILQGTDSILDGLALTPKTITHSFAVGDTSERGVGGMGRGYTTDVTLVNSIDLSVNVLAENP